MGGGLGSGGPTPPSPPPPRKKQRECTYFNNMDSCEVRFCKGNQIFLGRGCNIFPGGGGLRYLQGHSDVFKIVFFRKDLDLSGEGG